MATIRDVAKRAGVHPSTVSRVFSEKATISDETRERVLAAAEELGFWPNAIARSLSIKRTNTIGIVVPHVYKEFFDDFFFPQIMLGMLSSAYRHDYKVIVGGSDGPEDETKTIKQIMGSNQADGIVVMSSRLDVDTVGELIKQGTPFVLIGHPPSKEAEEVIWVDVNNQKATEEAIGYLIKQGHSKIAYVGGDPNIVTTKEREKAYRETMASAGLEVNPGWIDYGYFSEAGGYISVERMTVLGEEAPTAYFAANDLMAYGILRGLHEQNLRVPEDVSVFGTNDDPASRFTDPPLSTIHVPYAEMAEKAVDMLIEFIEGGTLAQNSCSLECSLVLRDSVRKLNDG
jgi:DNA-binding LacI/PurR family transcriptional regulator